MKIEPIEDDNIPPISKRKREENDDKIEEEILNDSPQKQKTLTLLGNISVPIDGKKVKRKKQKVSDEVHKIQREKEKVYILQKKKFIPVDINRIIYFNKFSD